MTIRLDRITVSREGPLAQDFDLTCGDLNLIYGANETGKSYIVECLIRCLFRTSGREVRNWSLRDWDPRASVSISGLTDTPHHMRPGTS
ncbi:MAG: ATP-binding protein, partial [Planctomycetaceae bacterium]